MTGDHDTTLPALRLTAAPDRLAARVLRRELNRVLLRDLRTLCTVAAKSLPDAAQTAQTALTALDQVDPELRLAPYLYAVHPDLRAALLRQDRQAALAQLDRLVLVVLAMEQHAEHRRLRLFDEANEVDLVMARTVAEADRARQLANQPVRAVDRALAGAVLADTRAALAVVADADPDLYGEADELVSDLVLAEGGPQAITALRCFGCVQIRRPLAPGTRGAVDYLTRNIAQETSRLAMFAMMNVDPMLDDAPDGTLYELVHTTFGLARLARLYGRLVRRGDHDAAARRDEQLRRFDGGYRTLLRHAALTPTGRRVLAQCAELAGVP